MKEQALNNKGNDPGSPLQNTKKTANEILSDGNNCARYSDDELKEFKELILVKLDNSRKELETLKGILSLKEHNDTKDTSPNFKLFEDGADMSLREDTANQMTRILNYIVHLENALQRINNKTFGICSVTGKLIEKERLRSVPHSTLSIEAKLGSRNK